MRFRPGPDAWATAMLKGLLLLQGLQLGHRTSPPPDKKSIVFFYILYIYISLDQIHRDSHLCSGQPLQDTVLANIH